jgi:RNA polymerase sigma factor (sigma-70 family)
MEPISQVDEVVEKHAERLKRTIGRFDPDRGGVELTITIEHLLKRDLYEVSGNLHLTNHHRLYARDENKDVQVGIGQTFDDLARQVRKLKTQLSSSRKAGSLAMNEAADLIAEEAGTEDEEPSELEGVAGRAEAADRRSGLLNRERLARLARTVRRELRYHTSLHDLAEDAIDPISVIDEAIAAALPRLDEGAEDDTIEPLLLQEVMSAVHRRVTEKVEATENPDVPTEQVVHSHAAGLESGSNSRYLMPFLEMEGGLMVEDLLPVDGATPDEVAETLEMEDRIDRVLSKFSPVVRKTFLLSTLENLSMEQVARTLNINEEGVRTHLAEAREALAEELRDELSPDWLRRLTSGGNGGTHEAP